MQLLCVYGSLAPGEPNHWVMSRIDGVWTTGTVRGYLFEITWGPAEGYQGFIADSEGPAVSVHVLESDRLDAKWREIDEFEGPGYERVSVEVNRAGVVAVAEIYQALTEI